MHKYYILTRKIFGCAKVIYGTPAAASAPDKPIRQGDISFLPAGLVALILEI